MSYYLLKPCKGHSGYLSTLKKRERLNLRAAAEKLKSQGYHVLDAKHLLVVRKDLEMTIYPNGRILVKTNDKEVARRSVEAIYELISPR